MLNIYMRVRLLICGFFRFGCRNVRTCSFFFVSTKIPPRDKIIPKACERASGGWRCSHVSATRRLCAKNADGVSRSTTRLFAARFARSNIRFSRVDSFAFFSQPFSFFLSLPLSLFISFSFSCPSRFTKSLPSPRRITHPSVFPFSHFPRFPARGKCTNTPLMTRTFINVSQIYD